jgi:hypothetical protein
VFSIQYELLTFCFIVPQSQGARAHMNSLLSYTICLWHALGRVALLLYTRALSFKVWLGT